MSKEEAPQTQEEKNAPNAEAAEQSKADAPPKKAAAKKKTAAKKTAAKKTAAKKTATKKPAPNKEAPDEKTAAEKPAAEKPAAKKAAAKKAAADEKPAAKKTAAKKTAAKKAADKAVEAKEAAPDASPPADHDGVTVSVEDELAKADGQGDDRPRRVRRSRAVTKTEDARPKRDDGERKPRQRKRKPRRDDKGGDRLPVGARGDRAVFKMDVHPDVAARQKEEAEQKRREEQERERAKNADKITLLLHPAPKQSDGRKKKGKPLTPKEALKAKTKGSGGKKKDDKDKPAAKITLKDAWLDAGIGDAVNALNEAGEGGEALVKAWLDRNNAAAVAAAANSDAVTGKARKAARRGLGVLKSRGIEIPVIESAAPEATDDELAPTAMFIPPDASGTTFFSISQRQKGGRYHVADIMFRTPNGIVHASRAQLAGHHLRSWEKRIQEQFGTRPVEVPVDWARHCIAEAKKLNASSGQIMPLGFDSCAKLIEPAPEKPPAHPLADIEVGELSEDELKKAAETSDELHAEPEFRNWMPDRPAIDQLLNKVGERIGKAESQEPEVVDDAVREETKAAADRFFTPELREILVVRMRDSAVSIRARSGDDAARQVLRVAKVVEQAGLVTSPPQEIPFLLAFFQKAVSALVRANQGSLKVPVPQG